MGMYSAKHFLIVYNYVFFLGEDFYEPSPYEPMTPHRHSDAFRLASIISGNYQYFHYVYIVAMYSTVLFVVDIGFFLLPSSYMKLK